MQTTLSPTSLRTFTKGLTCIARYGDELCIHATSEQLTLCATNSSKSAYCGIKFLPEFFDLYRVGAPTDAWGMTPEGGEQLTVRGQLLVKTLLSILRHKSVEKSLDKCELSVVEGVEGGAAEGGEEPGDQSVESRLVIRMHCKFGVIKTHKLYLNQPPVILAPTLPRQRASRVTIGPRAVRDLLDHFGRRADSQLQWMFSAGDVRVRSLERDADSQGKHQIATEISVPADEFDLYEVLVPPIGLAFHLREINASIALAESLSLPLELSFTEPSAPLVISLELDAADHLAMVATAAATGFGPEFEEAVAVAAAKRQRDEMEVDGAGPVQSSAASGGSEARSTAKRRTMKVVDVTRVGRTGITVGKGAQSGSGSGSGRTGWSTTPSIAEGSGPRGGTQHMQGTPSFALPPNAQSTQNEMGGQPGAPSFALDEQRQSTPRPQPSTPSFAVPPNAQSTQRPPTPPPFDVPPDAQPTFQTPRFRAPAHTQQSQRPPLSQLFQMPPPPARPLFMPSSQLSQAAEVWKEAGLGDLERMTQKELDELLGDDDADGEEEVPGTPDQGDHDMGGLEELFNESEFDADSQVVGTQEVPVARLGDKTFIPLFDD
ncbi:hypothetical protein FRC08_003991 [Ceratobasidium sp. 394]|nr:hypothetical protein FRC08_003991 [Ceratobasidium sp. 394]KAG9092130.1 hypothetical protein FS749_015983 [Ceratobasidium sp. UAMH 11750]